MNQITNMVLTRYERMLDAIADTLRDEGAECAGELIAMEQVCLKQLREDLDK